MGDVELAECIAWCGGSYADPGDVLLDMSLPCQIRLTVMCEEFASAGDSDEVEGSEKSEDIVDQLEGES